MLLPILSLKLKLQLERADIAAAFIVGSAAGLYFFKSTIVDALENLTDKNMELEESWVGGKAGDNMDFTLSQDDWPPLVEDMACEEYETKPADGKNEFTLPERLSLNKNSSFIILHNYRGVTED